MGASLSDNPANLFAVIVAARQAGNSDLEKIARVELRERFGVEVSFGRGRRPEESAEIAENPSP